MVPSTCKTVTYVCHTHSEERGGAQPRRRTCSSGPRARRAPARRRGARPQRARPRRAPPPRAAPRAGHRRRTMQRHRAGTAFAGARRASAAPRAASSRAANATKSDSSIKRNEPRRRLALGALAERAPSPRAVASFGRVYSPSRPVGNAIAPSTKPWITRLSARGATCHAAGCTLVGRPGATSSLCAPPAGRARRRPDARTIGQE